MTPTPTYLRRLARATKQNEAMLQEALENEETCRNAIKYCAMQSVNCEIKKKQRHSKFWKKMAIRLAREMMLKEQKKSANEVDEV